MVKLYSYVVEHDTGYAPNPYFGLCTLCRCKFRQSGDGRRNIVELATEGDWIIGTGGTSKRSTGHGTLVYAMRIDEKLTRWMYFNDNRFEKKKPVMKGTYEQRKGDNECPCNEFEKYAQFALVSRHFYYFGGKATAIPESFDLQKKGPGFRSHFEPADIHQFLGWLGRQFKPGKHGDPVCQTLVGGRPAWARPPSRRPAGRDAGQC